MKRSEFIALLAAESARAQGAQAFLLRL